MYRLCLLLAILFFTTPANAKPLVASMVAGPSSASVNIDSNFNGTELFMFGARNDPGDIIMVIRGPLDNYIVRKKERIAGIWVNSEQVRFDNVDGFYALASSRPLAEIHNTTLLNSLDISIDQLSGLLSNKVARNAKADTNGEFSTALFDYKQRQKLYPHTVENISFFGETLFSAVIPFSENIPKGRYIAEIYLFNSGLLAGYQSLPITVKKVGFDAFVSDFAYRHGFIYGVTAILLALGAGWFAGIIFRKTG